MKRKVGLLVMLLMCFATVAMAVTVEVSKVNTPVELDDNSKPDSPLSVVIVGGGSSPATNADPSYQKISDDGFWYDTRTDSSVLVADQVYTDTILSATDTASADTTLRITGISMGMWCSALWSIKINGVVVATGLCQDALNFAFPTPIPIPQNALVQLMYSMVKDSVDCRIIYTIYGDTR